MGGRDKLVQKFLYNSARITVEDCDRLLTFYGYKLHKKGGSHRTYHKKGTAAITVPIPKRKKYIASLYVKQIIKDLKLEENYGDYSKA